MNANRTVNASLVPKRVIILLGFVLLVAVSSACAPQAPGEDVRTPAVTRTSTEIGEGIVVTEVVEAEATAATPPAPTPSPAGTQAPPPTRPPPATAPVLPTPTTVVEPRVIELEWPPTMRLGESDVVRLALIPDESGYTLEADFPDHQIQSQPVDVDRPPGYALYASARMDGVGFAISPAQELERYLPPGEAVIWRWTIKPSSPGQQRLSVSVRLRWKPPVGANEPVRESMVLSQALDVRVLSILGLTQSQAMMVGVLGLILGGGLSLTALLTRAPSGPPRLRTLRPNPALSLEPHPGLQIPEKTGEIFRTLFHRYGRLVLLKEFPAGYSGAQTYLAQPIDPEGRADAHTVVKVGPRALIRQEYENYETYVKKRLPPVTGRIQHPPVTARGSDLAGLQYTFIGEPGQPPVSLREALLEDPDPALLYRLFDTFGPNWWMQRRPYTFRVAQEYDRFLPPHYVVAPEHGRGPALDGQAPPGEVSLAVGQTVTLRGFQRIRRRADGRSLSLHGAAHPGQPVLRVRWLSRAAPNGATGRVVATRASFLEETVRGYDRLGLPDPLEKLSSVSQEAVQGTRSTIHGDLNLENILQGPGGIVWLIDFAQTREGHTLLDFAHLYAEVVAHVVAARGESPESYLAGLARGDHRLLAAVRELATRCLFDPRQAREYDLALYMTCLGALKFVNVSPGAKHLLYLTAAHLGRRL